MEKYKASSQNAKVAGNALMAYYNASERDTFEHILEEYNLTAIDPDAWYPQQLTLDIQKAIKEKSDNALALVSVGMKIIETATFPPMNSLEEALKAFADSYPMNFRNQSPHDLIYAEVVGDNHVQVTNASPHSDAMIYGYVYALVKRFLPKGTSFSVRYSDPNSVDSPRNMVFDVTW